MGIDTLMGNETAEATEGTQDTQTEEKQTQGEQEEKKYEGGYKSVEDLEQGYKTLRKDYNDRNKRIKELESSYAVPENYEFDFKEHETLKDLAIDQEGDVFKTILEAAKSSGLSQKQAQQFVESFATKNPEFLLNDDSFKTELNKRFDEEVLPKLEPDVQEGLETIFKRLPVEKRQLLAEVVVASEPEHISLLHDLMGGKGDFKIPTNKEAKPSSPIEYSGEGYAQLLSKLREPLSKRDPDAIKEREAYAKAWEMQEKERRN